MKKKGLKVLGTAVALAMVPAVVFAAGSISRPSSGGSGGGGGSHSSSSSSGSTITSGTGAAVSATTTASKSTSVVTSDDGSKTSITSTVIDATTGYTVGVVVDTTTSTGAAVTNDNGAAAVGNSRVSLATGAEKTYGLPDDVVNTIAAVDAGNVDAVPGLANPGYHKVSQSMALINKNAAGQVQVADVETTLYCTTIPANGTLAILFYNNATNTYSYLPITAYDAAKKTVSFVLPTSGTAWIVAR